MAEPAPQEGRQGAQPRTSFQKFIALQLYDLAGPAARQIKILGQMLIGAALFAFVSFNAARRVFSLLRHRPGLLTSAELLHVVGVGLLYSAGLELAYMLFTKGPDEAVEPVLLGTAAEALIVLSGDLPEPAKAFAVLILAVSICLLLAARLKLLERTE